MVRILDITRCICSSRALVIVDAAAIFSPAICVRFMITGRRLDVKSSRRLARKSCFRSSTEDSWQVNTLRGCLWICCAPSSSAGFIMPTDPVPAGDAAVVGTVESSKGAFMGIGSF